MKKRSTIFESYLNWAPVSLAIREVSRIDALRQLKEDSLLGEHTAILDVGCGDGHWWKEIEFLDRTSVHGVDISSSEVGLASSVISAHHLDVTDAAFQEKLSGSYDLVIGNCSLEHVPKLDDALRNIVAVMRPGATLVIFVPTPDWALRGRTLKLLSHLSPRLSMTISGAMNGFFQHWHLYHYRTWERILRTHGLTDLRSFGIGNERLEFLFRLFLPPAFLAFLAKLASGRYLNFYLARAVPAPVRRWIARKIVSTMDDQLRPATSDHLYEYIIVGRNG